MKLVAITSMRLFDVQRQEWRAALDERWTGFLGACGLVPLALPNDAATAASLLEQLEPVGAILSGGGDCAALSGKPDARDRTEVAVLAWAQRSGKPVLGVCRGMQVLLAGAGARLQALEHHVATRHPVGEREVNSYHGFGAFDAPGFEVRGRAADGVVEAIACHERRLAGIMWHPERESPPADEDIQLVQTLFGSYQ